MYHTWGTCLIMYMYAGETLCAFYICHHVASAVIAHNFILLCNGLTMLSPLALMLDVEGVEGITEATPLTTPVVPAAALAVAVTMGRQGASRTRAVVAVWAGPNVRGKGRSVSNPKRWRSGSDARTMMVSSRRVCCTCSMMGVDDPLPNLRYTVLSSYVAYAIMLHYIQSKMVSAYMYETVMSVPECSLSLPRSVSHF